MLDMPRTVTYPYVTFERNRHGNRTWVFRRTKDAKRIYLKAPYDSDAFKAEYAAALAGAPAPEKRKPAHHTSWNWFVMQWKLSKDWKELRPATKRQRENILLNILEENGELTFAEVDEIAILDGMDKRADTPAAANNYLKTMRGLFSWAKSRRLMAIDPTSDVPFIKIESEGFTPWTVEDVVAYRARWKLGTRQRVAFEIYYWTGLRRGDACRFGKQHIQADGTACIRMEKTNGNVAFPVPQQLQETLDAGPCGEMTFIATAFGRPYKKESLGNEFREWCKKAGLAKGKSAHGIRKFAATDAAMNGATEAELKALFGWQTNNQSLAYTKAVRNKQLATSAIEKRGGNVYSANPETGLRQPTKEA